MRGASIWAAVFLALGGCRREPVSQSGHDAGESVSSLRQPLCRTRRAPFVAGFALHDRNGPPILETCECEGRLVPSQSGAVDPGGPVCEGRLRSRCTAWLSTDGSALQTGGDSVRESVRHRPAIVCPFDDETVLHVRLSPDGALFELDAAGRAMVRSSVSAREGQIDSSEVRQRLVEAVAEMPTLPPATIVASSGVPHDWTGQMKDALTHAGFGVRPARVLSLSLSAKQVEVQLEDARRVIVLDPIPLESSAPFALSARLAEIRTRVPDVAEVALASKAVPAETVSAVKVACERAGFWPVNIR